MKIYTVLIFSLLFNSIVFAQWCGQPNPSFCPGNYFTNGDFESLNGDPNTQGDTDIGSANGWQAMWNAANTMADLACGGTSQSPGLIAIPMPNSGVYAGMWINHHTTPLAGNNRFREGMYNKLSTIILANTGSYTINFDLADGEYGWGQPVSIGIYGVSNSGSLIANQPNTPNDPTNEFLWLSVSSSVQVVKLGSILVDPNILTNTWVNQTITFNSNMTGFPTQIDHIMIANDTDYRLSNSTHYFNFDNFCLQQSTPPTEDCCPDSLDIGLVYTQDNDVANVPNGAPWSQNNPLSIAEETFTITSPGPIPITELRVSITDFHFDYNYDACAECADNPGNWSSLGYRAGGWQAIGSGPSSLQPTTGGGYNPILGDRMNLRELIWENPPNSPGVIFNQYDQFSFNLIFPPFSEIPCCATNVTTCYEISWKDANCLMCSDTTCTTYTLDNNTIAVGEGPSNSSILMETSQTKLKESDTKIETFQNPEEDIDHSPDATGIRGNNYDKCDCFIDVYGTTVQGRVTPCPGGSPSKTKMLVTNVNSAQSQGQKLDYPGWPTIYNLTKGQTYHASVKSKFGLFWYSECGGTFTIDNDVFGTIQNPNKSFCSSDDILINASVSNERHFNIDIKKNGVFFYSNSYPRPLYTTENLKLLANNGISGFNFPSGQYTVTISAVNNTGHSKTFTLNFTIKPLRDCPAIQLEYVPLED